MISSSPRSDCIPFSSVSKQLVIRHSAILHVQRKSQKGPEDLKLVLDEILTGSLCCEG